MPNLDNNNENNPVRRRPSFGLLFSFLFVVAIIVLFVIFINGGFSGSTKTFTVNEFVTTLANDRITNIKYTALPDNTILQGDYSYKNSKGATVNGSYRIIITNITYQEEVLGGYEFIKDDGTKTTTIDSSLPFNGYESYSYTGQNDSISNLVARVHNYRIYKLGANAAGFIQSSNNPYETNFWEQWGPTILMLGGTVLICIFLFARLSGSINSSNNKALEFNKSRARRENSSKVHFDDVAGADEEKAEMQELVLYLKEPKKFSKFGAKLPKGVLLVGPPGCGKTLLAKAVAGEAGVPFYSISGSDFVEMFVGVGAGRVRDMFKIAKEHAPCLVFIDEIDAVGRQRGAGLGGGNDEREQTLNQLLVEMDGFSDNSGVLVIAATNRDDVLDPALLRAGRFDRKITVSLPDRKGREEIFKVHSRNKTLAKDVNFENIARRTVGFSGADIENIMNEAAILAVRKNATEITLDDIDEAIDRRVAGPAKSSRSLSAHEKEVVAYHEAGHAIIGLKLEHSDKVQKITIIPRGNTGGHVRMTPEEDRFLLTKKELNARIIGYLGGRSSEEIFFDDVTTGAQNDIEVATQIARMMVTELGMSSLGPIQYERDTGSVFLGRDYTNSQKNFSIETATKIDAEIRKIIEDAHKEALRIIQANKADVILIANTLIEHEQITAEEIDYLLEHRHLKRDEFKIDPTLEGVK